MARQEEIAKIKEAILSGQELYNDFKLSTPQKIGTSIQRSSYAAYAAEKFYDKLKEGGIRYITDKGAIKKFILDTLLPYKKDPTTCGYDGGMDYCEYLTSDNKKCAFGKHVEEDKLKSLDNNLGVRSVLKEYGYEILETEARAMALSPPVWDHIQMYHDYIATNSTRKADNSAENLETILGIKLPELYTH